VPPQPNPYGQQQAPYGQPQQPYGQAPYGQAPYGQQPPYGTVPQPPAPGGGKKKTALIIGAVAVVAAVAVAAYFVLGGGGGGGSVADDGPHKLVLPATVADYKKGEAGSGGTAGDTSADKLEKLGVKNGQVVRGGYSPTDTSKLGRTLVVNGAYGTIDDPAAAIDNGFAANHENAKHTGDNMGGKETVTWEGSPQSVTPDGLDGALMKCQIAKIEEDGATYTVPTCIWADHSTYGVVNGIDLTAGKTGGAGFSQDEVAGFAAKLRAAARVKA
jgi:hypothetical protein